MKELVFLDFVFTTSKCAILYIFAFFELQTIQF